MRFLASSPQPKHSWIQGSPKRWPSLGFLVLPCSLVPLWNSHPPALLLSLRDNVNFPPGCQRFLWISSQTLAWLFLFKTLRWQKNPKQSSDTRGEVSSKRTGERGRSCTSTNAGRFLLMQPLSRGINGNQQPNSGQDRESHCCCHHGDQSSGNSPALHTGGSRSSSAMR